jgi:AraC family transcriptional regulator
VSKGRLAGWQERRARDLIEERLAGDISISWLAKQCGLSVSYFARAFKETVGVPPYQWMLERRVHRAKELMHDRQRTLSDVALSCGFADQSHFSRAFSRVAGVPPGVWRRSAYGFSG